MDQADYSASDIALITFGLLSLATLFYLFQKHIAGRELVAYQPRRRVPWGPLVALLAMSMPLLTVLAFITNLLRSEQIATEETMTLESFMVMGSLDSAFKILFLLSVIVWLKAFFGADKHDLGLPTSRKQFFSDMGIGTIACLATLLPINFLLLTLNFAFESKTVHPLVKQLQENHSPAILLLSFVMAVLVAPLFEEFAFRGLLQGWLERREDESLAYAATERHSPTPPTEINEATSLRLETEPQNPDPPIPDPLTLEPTSTTRPTHGWVPDLPHGWTPILISGVAFGLAHLGHGVAPIPLILFGIVLGYLYQRTHRLVPSITAHLLFNAYSMVLLWLQLQETPT